MGHNAPSITEMAHDARMTLKEIRSNLLSPALPAAALLFGMVFFLAFASFSGLPWQPTATITLYCALFVWVALLAWRQRKLWGGIGVIDVLFGAFIFLVLVSLLIQGFTWAGPWKYGRYLPFMAIMPYMCGRLMRVQDTQLFFRVVASAALVMLMLLAIDYWQNAAMYTELGRWRFFGHYYSSLLIGALLAGSLIAFSFRFLIGGADPSQPLLRRAVGHVALGLVTAALVWVAARGAFLAGIMGTICLVLIVRYLPLSRRLAFFLYLAVIIGLVTFLLPKSHAERYETLLTTPFSIYVESASEPAARASGPIMGEASCLPLKQGMNSVAIRWVLYQEAVAMFINSPWWGVGAASFGRHSCAGEMGYPHSAILQAFAELGVIGGLLFVGLILASFISFYQKAVKVNATYSTQAAQQALAWFMMYLVATQISGNYFTDAGFYLLAGVAAGMQSSSAWNDGVGGSNVE